MAFGGGRDWPLACEGEDVPVSGSGKPEFVPFDRPASAGSAGLGASAESQHEDGRAVW